MGPALFSTPMLTSRLLPRAQIAVGILAPDVTTLFNAIGAAVARPGWPCAAQVSTRLAQRHARSSVALGHGMALPRAAVPGLPRPTAVFMRMASPLPMNTPDGEPVANVLCLLVPPPGFGVDRDLLDGLTASLCDPRVREALRRAHSVESIQHLLIAGLP